MAVLTFTLDDKLVTASDGQTLLEVCRENGVALPTLCHMEGLSDVGACRMCLVEVSGSRRPQPACVTRPTEGMQVRTDTEKLRKYRRMTVELLFAERNHWCSVCVANGHCELQNLAAAVGMDHVRFEYRFPACGTDLSHPRFGVDHNRCILCTRCVRACDEIEGAHTWDLSGRGADCRVITDLNSPWGASDTCTSCGKCVASCPTGALFVQRMSVAESQKDRGKIAFLVSAREKHQWNV